MTEHKLEMATEFIRVHPDAAARVLELQNPEQVTSLITDLDGEIVGPLLQVMLPRFVGQICLGLDARTTASLLAHVEISSAAAILRFLDKREREAVLSRLSSKKRAGCILLLSYPQDSVGAWMTPEVVTLPDDCTLESAKNYVDIAGEVIKSDYLYVVKRNRELVGRVSYIEIMRGDRKRDLQAYINTDLAGLYGRMSIQNAFQQECWSLVDVMPVVNRNQQFVGAIRHVDLRKGMEQLNRKPEKDSPVNPLSGIFEAYATTLLTLVNSLDEVFADDKSSQREQK